MWVAIRKAQGLSPNHSAYDDDDDADARLARHVRVFVRHEVKPDAPGMHPDVFTQPYDDLLFVKLRRWLLDERVHMRAQALDHIVAAYTEQREHRVRSLSYGMLSLLLATLLHDEQDTLRARAAAALELLVCEAATQAEMLRMHKTARQAQPDADATPQTRGERRRGAGMAAAAASSRSSPPSPIVQLLCALDDDSEAVVTSTLRVCTACHAYHNSFALTELLVQHDSVARILRLLNKHTPPQRDSADGEHGRACSASSGSSSSSSSSSSELRMAACAALLPIFDVKEAHVRLLQMGGVPCMTSQLRDAAGASVTATGAGVDDTQALLLAAAAHVLARMCEYAEGRRAAVRQSTLLALLPCAQSTHAAVRAAAAAAMAQVTVLEAAKMQLVDELQAVGSLVAWLQSEGELDVLVHLVRLLYHVAEYPPSRPALRTGAARLRELRDMLHGHVEAATVAAAAEATGNSHTHGNGDKSDGDGNRDVAGALAVAALDATLRFLARA